MPVNDCSGDDFVADTPNCADHNFGKPAFPHITCSNGPYGSVWWRRPQPPQLSEQMTRASHRQFAANELYEATGGFWQCMDAEWANDPARDQVAQRKAYRLKIAQQVGLRIPATLMTNVSFITINVVFLSRSLSYSSSHG